MCDSDVIIISYDVMTILCDVLLQVAVMTTGAVDVTNDMVTAERGKYVRVTSW